MDVIQKLAREVVDALGDTFIIQRYDSVTSRSVYLKFDYGVCNSLRLSDHEGKPYYSYKFNIGTHIERIRRVEEEYTRFYYPEHETERFFRDVIELKESIIQSYGYNAYQKFKRRNLKENSGSSGFWSRAKVVRNGKEEL